MYNFEVSKISLDSRVVILNIFPLYCYLFVLAEDTIVEDTKDFPFAKRTLKLRYIYVLLKTCNGIFIPRQRLTQLDLGSSSHACHLFNNNPYQFMNNHASLQNYRIIMTLLHCRVLSLS